MSTAISWSLLSWISKRFQKTSLLSSLYSSLPNNLICVANIDSKDLKCWQIEIISHKKISFLILGICKVDRQDICSTTSQTSTPINRLYYSKLGEGKWICLPSCLSWFVALTKIHHFSNLQQFVQCCFSIQILRNTSVHTSLASVCRSNEAQILFLSYE